ncbi:hypothetical protein KFE25_003008 [Diacronema lutheri]|uniref:Uncharacterized protein n=3 Tax=Diacronema lutheri TaxID=2081491 RepID=A0A8J5XBN9_DIALT|nr:hypothetical protein KFE25_003008 [Diacronema lutheri]
MADDEEEVIPKKPILVLGAGGFVGSAIAKAFVTAEDEEGWEVTGTLRAGTAKPKWITHVIEPVDTALLEAIKRSSVIVLDLVSEPVASEQVLQLLATLAADGGDESDAERVVIGVSTIMTWARTSPSPAEEEGGEAPPLTEEEYKRRRPHVNFRDQHTLEKLLVRSGSESVRTAVVCAGLLYGGAEELFHPLFKAAWHNQPLPLLSLNGDGANILPTLHIADLCSVVLKVAAGEGPQYLVAVDQAREQTLRKVTDAIAKHLGTGEVVPMHRDDVLLDKDVDYFQLDLRIAPTSVLDMGFTWASRSGLARGAAKVVAEYRVERRILPLKVLLTGPLAGVAGCFESEVAAALAAEYKVAHVTASSLVAAVLVEQSELADKVRAAKAADKQHTGALPDELMAQLVRAKLNSTGCTNQGWVLDGFPQTLPQLKLIAPEKESDADEEVEAEEEADEGEEETERPKPPADLTPESIIVVRMPDTQLKARVQSMSQPQVEATGMTAELLLKRMQAYAQAAAPEGPNNVLTHKALAQVEPLELAHDDASIETSLSRARIYLGRPRNYGPTAAEVAAKAERLEALRVEAEANAAKLEAERLAEEKDERDKLRAAEQLRIAERQQHEKALLESRSAPLRAYLMAEVIPTLTEGLIEVTKVRPEDPVDFLAEWIFKNNPVLD